MIDFELEELDRCDEWRRLLGRYQSLREEQVSSPEAEAEIEAEVEEEVEEGAEDWLPRLQSVEGIDDEDLSRIHGRLIAWGFLTFRLAGRMAGIQYQISPAGKKALARHAEPRAESDAA